MNTLNLEPFALTITEKSFDSDDAAWQFLRLNENYRSAFRRMSAIASRADALETILGHIIDPSSVSIAYAQDTSCAQSFGIAAWLDPDHGLLPKLKDGDSWFFALKRPIQDDRRRGDVGIGPPAPPERPMPIVNYPRLIADETRFGYGKITNHWASRRDHPYRERMIFVAIDCSVPPDGQISALKALAKRHQAYWREDGMMTTDDQDVIVEPIGWDDLFSHMTFLRAHDRGVVEESTADLWRVVGIDTLGPIGKEIEKCRRKLHKIYREHQRASVLKGLWPAHFPHGIPPLRGRQPQAPESNIYLKALLRLAQVAPVVQETLSAGSKDHADFFPRIAKQLEIRNTEVKLPQWMKNFDEEIAVTHLPRADAMVAKLYRWLVHAQISPVSMNR